MFRLHLSTAGDTVYKYKGIVGSTLKCPPLFTDWIISLIHGPITISRYVLIYKIILSHLTPSCHPRFTQVPYLHSSRLICNKICNSLQTIRVVSHHCLLLRRLLYLLTSDDTSLYTCLPITTHRRQFELLLLFVSLRVATVACRGNGSASWPVFTSPGTPPLHRIPKNNVEPFSSRA